MTVSPTAKVPFKSYTHIYIKDTHRALSLHADGTGYISLAYLKDFRMIKLYIPFICQTMEEVEFHFNLL